MARTTAIAVLLNRIIYDHHTKKSVVPQLRRERDPDCAAVSAELPLVALLIRSEKLLPVRAAEWL